MWLRGVRKRSSSLFRSLGEIEIARWPHMAGLFGHPQVREGIPTNQPAVDLHLGNTFRD
jgi:hypothetical protein